jgi:hypothetical protein
MFRVILFLLCLLHAATLFGQASTDMSCLEDWSQPVLKRAKHLTDSLEKRGVDTNLIYQYWVLGYSYGRVRWQKVGATWQYTIEYDREKEKISAVKRQRLKGDSTFSYYTKNHLNKCSLTL